MPALRGRLIALEGIDGSGKSTQAGMLADSLGAVLTAEPGGTALGRELRPLLLGRSKVGDGPVGDGPVGDGPVGDGPVGDGPVGSGTTGSDATATPAGRTVSPDDVGSIAPIAELLLMLADRAQDIAENILPALERGSWVVADRFSGSTLAYQGFGRSIDLHTLETVVAVATGGLEPDLTILVDVPVKVALERLNRTSAVELTMTMDRFESAGADFLGRVRDGYLELARSRPDAWAVIDGTLPVDDTAKALLGLVRSRLG